MQGTVSYLRLNVLKYFLFFFFTIVSHLVFLFDNIVILPSVDNKKTVFLCLLLCPPFVKQLNNFFPSREPCPVTWLKLKLVERECELLLGSGWKSLLSGRHKCSYFFHKHFTRQGTLKRNDSKNYWKINEDPCSLVFYGSPAFLSSAVFTQQVNLLLKNMKSSSTGLLKGKRP